MRSLVTAGAALAIGAAAQAQSGEPVQWRVEDGGNGHWYAVKTWGQTTSWETAKLLAQSIGGHLATITTSSEDAWTTQLTMDWTGAWFGITGPWIGATATCVCLDGNACFSWVTGEAFEYSRWHPGNPDNVTYAGREGLVGVCLWEPNWTRAWQDSSQGNPAWYGDSHRSALIEWSADCNSNGIVDFGEIRAGQLPDQNANNVPDGCECAAYPELDACCPGDLYPNGTVNGADLGILLAEWGAITPTTTSDLNRDGAVDGGDLGILLSGWGPCPG